MKTKSLFHSLGHAGLVFGYVSGVAWILFNAERMFGEVNSFIGPVMVLMLFVFSAAVVGSLVLGRPILLYLNGRKKEALEFFVYTLFWILVILLISSVFLRL